MAVRSAAEAGPLRDFAGGKGGKFFKVVPDYVDRKRKPGFSPLPRGTAWTWLSNALQLRHIWASPNLIWGGIALLFYVAFPYDLSAEGAAAAAPLSWRFFAERFPLWLAATQVYNLFWHVTLYALGWAERPFVSGRTYNWDKIAHNVFWSTMGVVIWTGFDNVFAFLWATGRLPYLSDAEVLSTPRGALLFALGFVAVPLWREAHFYFAHRLLHFKPLYYAVHSLHHRNQDIEPFAGLSMHPVEHLYYYACVFPALFVAAYHSPFHFVWNGIHLLLSPGASHSGFEDHMQSDAFHYLHHRYYECNYAGFGASALDVFFGTFMSGYGEREKEDKPLRVFEDAKSTLRAAPSVDFVAYLAAACACVAVWAAAAVSPATAALLASVGLTKWPLAVLAGAGPVAVAMPWYSKAGGTALTDGRYWPGSHVLVGSAVCSLPVVWAAALCL